MEFENANFYLWSIYLSLLEDLGELNLSPTTQCLHLCPGMHSGETLEYLTTHVTGTATTKNRFTCNSTTAWCLWARTFN